ncbi:siderophore-interacting protein [Rhodococcus sp. X156]|uniref:siderophore-interacting protein n=1 Tax=Rhodococcus sp. X156 TaxID=2499145 RepID=UPI001F49BF2E|nr:siderophore-interacting protein [Rhodococcus sp. X156]
MTQPATKPKRAPIATEVLSSTRLSPHMVRVVLTGPGLRDFPVGSCTDHYVKLLFPPAGASYGMPFDVEQVREQLPKDQWPCTRTFTVRAYDPAATTLTLDFVVHGDTGLAGAWALHAQPGDQISLMGPGGGYTIDPDAEEHLLVGDATALPAIAVALEQLPAGARAQVVVEVDGPADEQELPSAADMRVRWLHRGDSTDPDLLLAAVRELTVSPGAQAFVHGEAAAVRSVRRYLRTEVGIPVAALSASGYWKRGRTDEVWRAEKKEWNRLAELDDQGR